MDEIYTEVANKVRAVMRIDSKIFNTAFTEVMQNYKHLDFANTKSTVGGILGSRNKGRKKRKKIPGIQLDLLLEAPSIKYSLDAQKCEASLIAGIPMHDL